MEDGARATTREEKLAALSHALTDEKKHTLLSCGLTDEEVDAVYEHKRANTLMQRLTVHGDFSTRSDAASSSTDMTKRFRIDEAIQARNGAGAVFSGIVNGVTVSTVFVGGWHLVLYGASPAGVDAPPSFFIFRDGIQVNQEWNIS